MNAEVCGQFVVVFLDVLGQRQLLRQISGPATPATCKSLVEAAKQVVLLRRDFRQYFSVNPDMAARIGGRHPHLEVKVDPDAGNPIYINTFSDCVTIAVSLLGSQDQAGPASNVYSALYATCSAVLLSTAREHPVRGGIELGPCVTLPDNPEVYGAALEKAYGLERDAGYPRVVIGPELIRYLDTLATAPSVGASVLARGAAVLSKALITTDEDNRRILDYLGPGLRTVPEVREVVEQMERPIHEFVRRSAETFAADEKLGPRYHQMLRYVEKRTSVA